MADSSHVQGVEYSHPCVCMCVRSWYFWVKYQSIPTSLFNKQDLDTFTGKLGLNYNLYQHVVAPIRLLGEVKLRYMSSQIASLQIFGHQGLSYQQQRINMASLQSITDNQSIQTLFFN